MLSAPALSVMLATFSYAQAPLPPGSTGREIPASIVLITPQHFGFQPFEDVSISGDGRIVAYSTYASLDPDDFNGRKDVYLSAGFYTVVMSLSLGLPWHCYLGGVGDADAHQTYLSRSGGLAYVASVDVGAECMGINQTCGDYVYSPTAGLVAGGACFFGNNPYHLEDPVISDDGKYVAFLAYSDFAPGDSNGGQDVYLWEKSSGALTLVTAGMNGHGCNDLNLSLSISADGRFLVFSSYASDLLLNDPNNRSDVFLFDRLNQSTEMISLNPALLQPGNDHSFSSSISASGQFVAFASFASNLLQTADTNGNSDVFVYDRDLDLMEKITRGWDGSASFSGVFEPMISGDGSRVVFTSNDGNLVPLDINGLRDVFLHVRATSETRLITQSRLGLANGMSNRVSISNNGKAVAFASQASNLVPYDINGVEDVFLWRDR